jgi:tetratricopeptide (TPR) repeat protein
MAAAMVTGINLGVRHILPVYPFVILVAAAGVKAMVEARTKYATAVVAALFVAGAAEFARAYPYPLSFFNQVVGGPEEGYRYLADSNLGWGGNLERLKEWMDRERVQHVNLAYFGQADPAYYRIDATHLPGAPGFATDRIARPKLPGYVAISPTIMHGVYAPPQWRLFYESFADLAPAAVIGNSLRVYWIDQWPAAKMAADAAREEVDGRRALADALLFGMHWPEQAATHYQLYLQRRPGDAEAHMHLGLALVAAGRTADAMTALRDAVAVDPAHGPARLTLARALFGSGDLPGASRHGREAVRLLPDDADAHDFFGRVLAAHGQFDEAGRHFSRALEIDPSHVDARHHVAKLAGMP